MTLQSIVSNILNTATNDSERLFALRQLVGQHGLVAVLNAMSAAGASQALLVALRNGGGGHKAKGPCDCDTPTPGPCGGLGSQAMAQSATPPADAPCGAASDGFLCADVGEPGIRPVYFTMTVPPDAVATQFKFAFSRSAYLMSIELFAGEAWVPDDTHLLNWRMSTPGAVYETFGGNSSFVDATQAATVKVPSAVFVNAGYLAPGGPEGTYRPNHQHNNWIPRRILKVDIGTGNSWVSVDVTNSHADNTVLIPGVAWVDFRA